MLVNNSYENLPRPLPGWDFLFVHVPIFKCLFKFDALGQSLLDHLKK